LATPADEKAGDLLGLGLAVGDFGRQDVPDDDQQFASNGDDSLLATDAKSQGFELLAPVLIVTDSNPGGFDQDSPQFLAAWLGNPAAAMSLTGSVDFRAQAGITDQLFGQREAADVAKGWGGKVKTSEPLLNVVNENKPKVLTGLSQKARGQV
jgi:hypothetical protein